MFAWIQRLRRSVAPSVSREDRIRGGMWGLLAGDALGVPYEFASPKRIPPLDQIDMVPPVAFMRSHAGVKPGTWSDDGAQALCLAASLLEKEGLDAHDLMDRIVRWYRDGYMAVGHDVFDVGDQTRSAAETFLRGGMAAIDKLPATEWSNGNGSLMRVLPLALWHHGSEADLVRAAFEQSRVTHAHLRSKLCCAFLCLWARRLLEGLDSEPAWQSAADILEQMFPQGTLERIELDDKIQPREEIPGKGKGYVVDSLHSARQVLREPTWEGVARAAVALGNDTDTTACIACGIAGVRFGVAGIPARWMKLLRGQEIAEPLVEALVERARRRSA